MISFSFQDNSPITWDYWIIICLQRALKYNHCLLYRRVAYIWNNTFMLLSINFSANRLICFGMTANINFPNLSLATTLNLFYEYRLFDVEKKTVVLSRYVLFSHCYLWNRSFSAIISRKKNLQRIQYLRWDEKRDCAKRGQLRQNRIDLWPRLGWRRKSGRDRTEVFCHCIGLATRQSLWRWTAQLQFFLTRSLPNLNTGFTCLHNRRRMSRKSLQ